MTDEQQLTPSSPFDAIRHESAEYGDYWSGRELYKLLGYSRWEKFRETIERAKKSCEEAGEAISDHFHLEVKMIATGKGAKRKAEDIYLSRYACYLTLQNADPNGKPIVGMAQSYFAVQTRRQELTDAETFAQLSEDEKRLIYRAQLSLYNRKLADTAHQAGVVTANDHAQFADAGYEGLYGGLTENDIHTAKDLAPKEEISNWMAAEELADNIFRAAQTDAAMKRDQVQGKDRANTTHFTVGRKVRDFIVNELGGTPPEALPTPQKSVRQLEQEEEFRLKHKDQPSLFDQLPEEGL